MRLLDALLAATLGTAVKVAVADIVVITVKPQ